MRVESREPGAEKGLGYQAGISRGLLWG